MTMFSSLWFSPAIVTGTNTANASSTSNVAVHTFSGQSLGAADSSRIIAVAVGAGDNAQNRTITSVTVGGEDLTKRIAANNSTPTGPVENFAAEIWSGAIPSGTTADIVVTMSGIIGTKRGVAISVHSLVGAVAAAPSATATDNDVGGSSSPLELNVNTQEGGYVIGYGVSFKVAPSAGTWSGLTELTDLMTGNMNQTAANYSPTSNETPRTITLAFTLGSHAQVGVAASWFPV
tara:strand:+ start:222 stop:923 length:702 start_codon:yes stop_codon:yes gene_type:complete